MNISDLLGFLRTLGASAKRKAAIPTTVAQLEAALADITRERAASRAILSGIADRRQSALIDGDDAAIDALEREERAAHLALERLDAIEERVFAELAARRSADRLAQGESLAVSWRKALEAYSQAARELIPLAMAARDAHENLINGGFREAESAERLPSLSHETVLVSSEIVARYEASSFNFIDVFLAQLREAKGRKREPEAWPAPQFAPLGGQIGGIPPEALKEIEARNASEPKLPKSSAPSAPKPAPAPPPAPAPRPVYATAGELPRGADGMVTIEILRGRQVKTAAGEVLRPGRHRLPPELAFAALRGGSADLADDVGEVTHV